MRSINIHYPIAEGDEKFQQLTLGFDFMSFESIEVEIVRKRLYCQDGALDCCMLFRYGQDSIKDKIQSKIFLAPNFLKRPSEGYIDPVSDEGKITQFLKLNKKQSFVM